MTGAPFPTFREASDAVLEHLQEQYPMGLWMVTRTVADDWIVLRSQDGAYGVKDGDLFRWSDSFCSRMVIGQGPHIAPDSAQVAAYAEAPIGKAIPIAAYIGYPLEADGEFFGTLCAIDSRTKPAELTRADPQIALLARLLSTILEADMRNSRLSALADSLLDVAHRDALTGVLNRRGWEELLLRAEHNREEYGRVHCVVVVDLDRLKHTNDKYGHAAGDQLLVRTAGAINRATRRPDIVSRIGGDEFGILLEEPDCLQPDDYLRRLREALAHAGVQASVGLCRSGAGVSIEQAAREADMQMYRDKSSKG